MRIGLAGVPGSGKTMLAKALKEEFEKSDEYKSIEIIDDYVPEIEEETDLALGFFGTYIGNIHVALGREYREAKSYEANDVTITCGTLFETSGYLALFMEREFSLIMDDAEDEKYNWNLRTDAAMRLIACLYLDAVRYNKIYHLEPVSTAEDSDLVRLEGNIQAAFNAFELFPVTHLEAQGDSLEEITKYRVNKILEEIKDANNAKKQDVQTQESN